MENQDKSQPRGRLGRFGRAFLKVLAVILLLGAVGYIFQVLSTAGDSVKYPPPGKLVDVDGHKMHIYCQGEGSPSVIVEAGNGDFSLGWSLVQPEVAKFTRICTYDRLGYGWSDTGPKPRSTEQIVSELHALLTKAKIEPPYILVGQSLGGTYVRKYAEQFPDEVEGMVLVDASNEHQKSKLPPEFLKLDEGNNRFFRAMSWVSRFGLLRFIGLFINPQSMAPAYIKKLPKDVRTAYLTMMSHPSYFTTTLAEKAAFYKSVEEKDDKQALADLGDMPLIVLTAETTIDPSLLAMQKIPENLSEEWVHQVWMGLQDELAALSTNSTHVVATGSGHGIQLDRPDLVIEAIRKLVEATK